MFNEEDKKKITTATIKIFKTYEITKEIKELTPEICITIINEIVECVKSTIDVTVYLKNVESSNKPGVILELIVEVLSSPELENEVSPEVQEQLRNISSNAEAMNIILKLVNYLNGKLLESLDNDGDGRVTVEEVQADIVDCLLCKKKGCCACYKEGECCSCCPAFSNKVGEALAKFFVKVICCGCDKNYITRK